MAGQKNLYIGVDIGGTKVSAALVDSRGRILFSQKCPTPSPGTGAQILKQTKSLISRLLTEGGVKAIRIRGIGVGVPGVVRPDCRDILITPNVGLSGYPLAQNLEKAFKAKVFLGNDVNLGLLGEQWLGIGKEANNLVGLFPGTGVGGAIIIDGQLILGAQGAAGEIGHMILDLNSKKTSAGLFGTLEAMVSRRAIEHEIKEAIQKGSKTVITKICGKRPRAIKSSVLSEALSRKDPLTVKVIQEVSAVLGKACISLRHILNPEMIILGGGVMEACGDYILPQVRKVSDRDPFFKNIDACRIEQSLLGDDAVILGAVALLKRVFGEKVLASGVYYPGLGIDKKGNVLVNGKIVKKSFYIRADGRMKRVNEDAGSDERLTSHELGVNILKKICKKSPKALIVGSRKNIRFSRYARRFLDKKNITCRLLTLEKAAKAYNVFKGRKAVVLHFSPQSSRGSAV